MNNIIGVNVRQYDHVVIRNSIIGDNSVIADDVFMDSCNIGCNCIIERRGFVRKLIMGDYSYSSFNTVIEDATIGKFCSISWNVGLGGADHDINHLTTHPFPFMKLYGIVDDNREGGYLSKKKPVIVGNDVWIGANAFITRGVIIEDGAVIAAGAVVTHNVGPYEVWAGVPAKKIGQRFPDEIIAELRNLKWWELDSDVLKKHSALFLQDVTMDEIYYLKEIIINNLGA